MRPLPSATHEASNAVGKLCVGGDWACAHGDFAGLRCVALDLCDYAPEPLHCELVAIAAACASEPERAAALWNRVKNRLYREARA